VFPRVSRRRRLRVQEHADQRGLIRDLGGRVSSSSVAQAGKAIAIAPSCICAGSRGRFFDTVDLVNRLEAAARASRQGLAEYLTSLPSSDRLGLCQCSPRGAAHAYRRRSPPPVLPVRARSSRSYPPLSRRPGADSASISKWLSAG
jgi:hypothetical protein